MARPLRLEFAGAVYHLTARGNDRQSIFVDDEDRVRFLDLLEREIGQQRWRCHAYCLMGNHYHLLIETPEGNLIQGMRRLNGSYTQAFNRRHRRVGHLFQGRYKSILVDRDRYLLALARYVVLNPVRAKLVADVAAWRWSSFAATAGLVLAPPWLETAWLLGQFHPDPPLARSAYRRFVEAGITAPSPWDELRGQIWLGGEDFLARMSALAREQPMQEVPSAQIWPARPQREEVLHHVGEAFGINSETLLQRTDQPAFRAAAYLLRRVVNLSLKEVAALFRVSPARISRIQREVEQGDLDSRLAGLLELYKVKN